jgi:hypothetical protein
VQLLLECAVMHCPSERAASFLNHCNNKGQSALILAAANG